MNQYNKKNIKSGTCKQRKVYFANSGSLLFCSNQQLTSHFLLIIIHSLNQPISIITFKPIYLCAPWKIMIQQSLLICILLGCDNVANSDSPLLNDRHILIDETWLCWAAFQLGAFMKCLKFDWSTSYGQTCFILSFLNWLLNCRMYTYIYFKHLSTIKALQCQILHFWQLADT